MAVVEQRTRIADWMLVLGLLLTLMGLYGFVRIVHISSRGVPYPLGGVLPSTILLPSTTSSFGHETDCDPYPQLYYEADNKTVRQPTEAESYISQQLKQRCVNSFDEDRSRQAQVDKNTSSFLVFVGIGLILGRSLLARTWKFL